MRSSFDPENTPGFSVPHVQSLSINGVTQGVDAEAERLLLSVLRDDLGLTGTKYGCGEAQCGACVVLVDGQPVPSCITPVGEVQSKAVTTIEGLSSGDQLHPVQEAFIETGAMQCGYCTPGMIMEVVALLRDNARPDKATIVAAMDRHICRCGAYARILSAIEESIAKKQGETA